MDDSGSRGSAHHHRVTGEIGLRDRGKHSIFLVTNGNKLDCAISAQCVHHRIQCVPDDSITALDSSLRQHLPQYVCNFFRHKNLPDFPVDLISVPCNSLPAFTSSLCLPSSSRAILYFGVHVTQALQFRCHEIRGHKLRFIYLGPSLVSTIA